MQKAADRERPAAFLGFVMSRGGLEPPTHWLKASCSTN